MSQINDAILAVVGPGDINDQLLIYYNANNGGEPPGSSLQDAERIFLEFRVGVKATINDMWFNGLRTAGFAGSIGDMKLAFWASGGIPSGGDPPIWTTNPPNPPDGEFSFVYPGHNFQDDVDILASFTVTAGVLPSGLILSTEGLLAGTPNVVELQSGIAVTALNFEGGTESLPFDINISDPFGPELLTNGGFDGNATGWTLGTGWSYNDNNVITNGNASGTLSQGTSAELIVENQLTFDIVSAGFFNGLGLFARLGGSGIKHYFNTVGPQSVSIIRDGNATLTFGQDNSNDANSCVLDNISLKEIL